MHIFRDEDANLELVQNKKIGIIGYGNQGRAQALNLRDSGMDVLIGNRSDTYSQKALEDGFFCLSIKEVVKRVHIIMLLIPDEVIPNVFDQIILPGIRDKCTLVFASGYNIAFKQMVLPNNIDVILLAPRMIGVGVRENFLNGRGYPSFIGVEQDVTGNARQIALALAKGIGSTTFGAVEVTFQQEAELDLFTEQCFGPAFGNILTSAVDLLLERGYPPEAVLLELYMSGELAYTFQKIAEMGIVEQSSLHSLTSQYGSLSRGMRFLAPEIRERMLEGLNEICSGEFAREWRAEQDKGASSLTMMKEIARSLPLHKLESELLEATGKPRPSVHDSEKNVQAETISFNRDIDTVDSQKNGKFLAGWSFQGLVKDFLNLHAYRNKGKGLEGKEYQVVLQRFLNKCESDKNLIQFAAETKICIVYQIEHPQLIFFMQFGDRKIKTGFGEPQTEADIRIIMQADLLDSIFTRQTNAMRAAISGKMRFHGDTRLAMRVQKIQEDLCRIYIESRN